MTSTISCLARSPNHAYRIVNRLRASGLESASISVLCLDVTTSGPARESTIDDVALGAGVGGVIGSTLGLLAGIGTIVVPGLGPVVAVGPILALVGGAATGAAVGGLTGALVNVGIPSADAGAYERRIAGGDAFIAVRADTKDELGTARRVFEEACADDIRVRPETVTTV